MQHADVDGGVRRRVSGRGRGRGHGRGQHLVKQSDERPQGASGHGMAAATALAALHTRKKLRPPVAAASEDDRTFGAVPLFMADEDPARLMRHAPPYGYKFGAGTRAFRLGELHAKRANATLPSRRHFRSCAVVGSSGTLLKHRLGHEIDAHHAVIRVNGAPLSSQYAEFVGTKTTWRFFSSPHAASDFTFHEQRVYPNQTMLVRAPATENLPPPFPRKWRLCTLPSAPTRSRSAPP